MRIPMETYRTCDFPGDFPPLDLCMTFNIIQVGHDHLHIMSGWEGCGVFFNLVGDSCTIQLSRKDIVLAASVRPFRSAALFVCPEPYLSTYWSDLIHSWYK